MAGKTMKKRCSGWDFVIGLTIGLVTSGLAALAIAELKHFIERERLGVLFELLPPYDESYSGQHYELGDEVLGEMAERAREQSESGEIRGRRAYRNGEPQMHRGEGDFAAYYDE
jgi:hypothetical protein